MNQNQNSVFASVRRVSVDDESSGRRLDNFLISLLHGVPHSHVYHLIRTGQVRVNSARVKAGRRLELGDVVRVPPVVLHNKSDKGKISPLLKEAVQRIVFEDDYLLVLDKPAGITVHSGTRHNHGLIEALRRTRDHASGIELVHRLDKETSGVLVLAKTHRALRYLQAQWRRESDATSLKKHYSALLKDRWQGSDVKQVITENKENKSERKSSHRPGDALSYFTPVRNFNDCVLVDIELHTGKTHQARQHAQQIGQPIAGDLKYGDTEFNQQMRELGLKRMFLHASQIKIIHPSTEKTITFKSRLPAELEALVNTLTNQVTDHDE